MKKTYETPVVEKVAFQYEEQVVASNQCGDQYLNTAVNGSGKCDTIPEWYQPTK